MPALLSPRIPPTSSRGIVRFNLTPKETMPAFLTAVGQRSRAGMNAKPREEPALELYPTAIALSKISPTSLASQLRN